MALAVVFNLVNPTASLGNFQISSLFGLPESPTEEDHSHDTAPFARDIQFVVEEEIDEEFDEFDDDDNDTLLSRVALFTNSKVFCSARYNSHSLFGNGRLFILYCSLKIDF